MNARRDVPDVRPGASRRRRSPSTGHGEEPRPEAARGRADGDADDAKAPWHFKLLMVLLVLYLGWRIVDLFL